MSSRKWTEDETLQFIQLYRKQECIWNKHSQNYGKKKMVSTSLLNICSGLNIEDLTVKDVKGKIISLTSTYYSELDKINKSLRSGIYVYVPKVKWFTELHEFIKEATTKRSKTTDNYTNKNTQEDGSLLEVPTASTSGNITPPTVYVVDDEEDEPSLEEHSTNALESTAITSGKRILPPPTPTAHASTSKRSKPSQMPSTVADIKKVKSEHDKEEDDFDIFVRSVASQIKKLSEVQATIARDEIQRILTNCKIKDILSKNSNRVRPKGKKIVVI